MTLIVGAQAGGTGAGAAEPGFRVWVTSISISLLNFMDFDVF